MYNKKQLKSGPHTGGKTNPNKDDVPYGYVPVGYYPSHQNPDGSYSNEVSMGLNVDNQEMLLPSFWNGQRHTPEETIAKYRNTGEHLGKFNTVAESERAAQLREFMNNEVDPYSKKKGGALGGKQLRLDKRPKTSQNIKSSLNEILMRRNEMLFGPPGRRWYKPFDGGGELTPEEEYFQYLQDLEAEKQRVEQARSNVPVVGEKALGLKDQANILKTKLKPIAGQKPFYCSTRSCEIEKAAGVTIPEDVVINGKLYPKGSPMPIIPGTEQWASNAKKLGYEKVDPSEKQPGDRVFALTSKGERFHSLIAGPEEKYFNDHGSGTQYGLDYSYWDPRFKHSGVAKIPQDVYRYVGNVPQYEEQLAEARKKITPTALPMKSVSLLNSQEPELNIKSMAKSKAGGETPEAFPQQPTSSQLFKMSFIPQGPVGFYEHGGPLNTNMIAFPQQPPADIFFSNGIPWQPHYGMGGGMPCMNCGGPKMDFGGDQFGGNVDGNMDYFKSGGHWIQDATKNMRTDKPCTGSKFGGPECPPGSRRYNLAKTFRAMAKKEEGGPIDATDQQGYLQQYNGQIKRAIKNNLQPFIASEAADAVSSMEQNAQANMSQYAAMGMETGMMNPQNAQRMQMYQDQMDQLNGQAQNSMGNLFGAGMNLANTANPYMDYSVDQMRMGGLPKAKTGYELAQERMMGDFPKMTAQTNPNIFASRTQGIQMPGNRSQPMTPQQQAQMAAYIQQVQQAQGNQKWTTPTNQAYYNPNQSQGMNYIPANYNPGMSWRTSGMPNVGFNPQDTYLQSYEAKKRLFGPGARKVKMTFRTYRDPMTGQVTQQPGQQGDGQWTPDERAAMAEDAAREQKWGAKPYQPEQHNEAVDNYNNANWFEKRRIRKDARNMMKEDNNRNQRMSDRAAEHGPITPYGASPFSAGFPASYNLPAPTNNQMYDNKQSSNRINLNVPAQNQNQLWRPQANAMPNFIPGSMYGGPLYDNGGDFQDWSMTGRYRMGLDPTASAEGIMGLENFGIGLANANRAAEMKKKMQTMSLADNQVYSDPANRIQSKGRWVDTGMGFGTMDPNNMNVIQQPGQNFMSEGPTSFTRFGGPKYDMGGASEQYLSQEEIDNIIAQGGQVDYLD